MKKIILLTEHYPSNDNIYNYMFIHSRALEYVKKGCEVKVLYLSDDKYTYNYEGIDVYKGDIYSYKDRLIAFNADVVFIHSPKEKIINQIDDFKKLIKLPTYTWIHGVEALSLYRRTFNVNGFKGLLRLFTKGAIIELKRKFLFRKYVNKIDSYDDYFIFVSKWMKDITESDNFVRIKKYKIIPNFIDSESFVCNKKRNNKSFLIVRSFDSKKYANDISMDILNKLYKKRDDFSVTIYGDGKLFDTEVSKLKIPKNKIKMHREMLSRNELSKVLNDEQYGFFLCPTRQDAQGVTMCEGMSSQLVIITNPSTAIPEFVSDDYAVVSDNIDNTVDSIIKLMDSPSDFNMKAINARNYIITSLSSEICISKELKLLMVNDEISDK